MVVVMEERATEAQIENVVARLVEMGMDVHRSTGVSRTVLGAVGQGHPDKGLIEMLEGVHEVVCGFRSPTSWRAGRSSRKTRSSRLATFASAVTR
jgi:3-deoxy-7-phosphoheptulonate synthase